MNQPLDPEQLFLTMSVIPDLSKIHPDEAKAVMDRYVIRQHLLADVMLRERPTDDYLDALQDDHGGADAFLDHVDQQLQPYI